MRRFLVEAVIDAIIALAVILLLSLISVGQPFPFGTPSAPILALRGAGVVGFVIWAGDPRARQPVRPTGARGPHRPAAAPDHGRVRGGHQRDRASRSPGSSPRSRSPRSRNRRSSGSSWPPRSTRSCRPSPMRSSGSTVRDFGRRRANGRSGGCSSRFRRRAGTSSSRTSASSRSTTRSTRLRSTSASSGRRSAASGAGSRRVSSARRTRWPARSGPARVRVMLQRLGPTYVKIGQMAASRADLLPEEWMTELAKLQSDAAPVPLGGRPRRSSRPSSGKSPEELFALDRPRAVRGRLDRPGPPGDAPRRDRWSRSRSSGRGSWPRRRPTSGSSRSSPRSPSGGSAWPARSMPAGWSTSSPQASSRSSTTATRPTTPSGSPMG